MDIHTPTDVHQDYSLMISTSSVHSKKKPDVVHLLQVSLLCQMACKSYLILILLLLVLLAVAPVTDAPLDLAQKCDPAECVLPYCYCSKDGTSIPKDLSAEEVSNIFAFMLI